MKKFRKLQKLKDKFEDKKHKLKTPNRKQSSNANDFQSLNKTTGTTGLGLSEIETTPAPPDFDEPESTHKPRRLSTHTASQKSKRESVIHYEKNVELPKNRPRSSVVESIKYSLASLNSDSDLERSKSDVQVPKKSARVDVSPNGSLNSTDSEINFPVRSVEDAKEYLNRLKKKNAQQKAKLVEQKLEIETLKKGQTQSANSHSVVSSGFMNIEEKIKYYYGNYTQKEKNSPSAPIHHPLEKSELFMETVNTVFDQEGNIVSRTGDVISLGSAEFNPARTSKSQIDSEDLKAVELEIEKFEKKRLNENKGGKVKPAKYFYKGRQISPNVNFDEKLRTYEYDTNTTVQSVDYVQFEDMMRDMKLSDAEITRNIARDLLVDFQRTRHVELKDFSG